jgi:hypothetical protein
MWGSLGDKANFILILGISLFAVIKEVVGIHVLLRRLLFVCDILRRFLRRVSLVKSTSALLRF